MKRTPLRRTPRTQPGDPLTTPKVVDRGVGRGRVKPPPRAPQQRRRGTEPGEKVWKIHKWGTCAGCNTPGPVLGHHIVYEQVVRAIATPEQIAAGICWDPRNRLPLGLPLAWGGRCNCHDGHHHPGVNDTRLPFSLLPPSALEFAHELLGDHALDWLRKRYR